MCKICARFVQDSCKTIEDACMILQEKVAINFSCKSHKIVVEILALSCKPCTCVMSHDVILPHDVNNCVNTWHCKGQTVHCPCPLPHSVPVSLSDMSPVGSYVTELHAVDPDGGSDGEITYSIISGNEDGFFQISPAFGTVTVQHSPLLAKVYNLIITVTDHSTPPRSSRQNAVVVVNVIASTPVDCSDPRYSEKLVSVVLLDISMVYLTRGPSTPLSA